MTLLIEYTCPDCGHEWQETYECACDSECPKCGTRNISAAHWAELSTVVQPKQTYIVRQWRIVEREAKFQATSAEDAIAQARAVDENESDWEGWETSDGDAGQFVATPAGEPLKQPYTIILMLDTWEDFSIYHVEATGPRAAIVAALVNEGQADDAEEAEELIAGHINDVSVLAGTHSQVFGLTDLQSNH